VPHLFPLAAAATKVDAGSHLLPPTANRPLVPPLPEPAPPPLSAFHFTTICGWLGRALVLVCKQLVRPFSNKTAPMDNNPVDEISTNTSVNNEFFYKNFFED
jgi:hypothetical protein